MKNNCLYLLIVVASAIVSCLYSCDKPVIDELDKEHEVPVDSVAVIDTTESGLPMFSFPKIESLPLEVGNLLAEGSDVGVTIEVTKVEHQNFVFELRPGAQIQSFRFDVFPLSQLYNSLLNDQMVGKDVVSINEQIRNYIFAEDGSGGFQISVNDFATFEDFLQIEYDWMSTTYAPATAIAIPDCDYVIAVVACTGNDCSSSTQEELTLCFVHTTSEALVGDPQVDIEVNAGYTAFAVNHIPNQDAAGVYYFGWLTQEIDAYIDTFGNRLFRDFMRTRVTSPSSASDPAALAYSVEYGQAADHRVKSTTCAVAVDANLTPAKDFARKDFNLLEIPQDQPEAAVTVDIIDERVAAAYFEFEVSFTKDCQTFFMRVYTEEQKLALEKGTADARAKEAYDMMTNGGWGAHNPNFLWDAEKEEAVGSGAKIRDVYYGGIRPGGTYYMGYVGRNRFQTLTDLQFSEPIRLDARNLTSSDNCKVKDFKLSVTDVRRTSYHIDIEYDPATVSMVYCSYFFPGAEGFPLTKESPWKDWVDYIFAGTDFGDGTQEYSNLNVNAWPTLPSGYDEWGVTGMTPGTEYTVFVCAEDFDGNISEILMETVTTTSPTPGPDPTVEMKLSASDAPTWGEWMVSITAKKDVKQLRYALISSYTDLQSSISSLNKYHWDNLGESSLDYQKWSEGLYDWCVKCGMPTESESAALYWNGSGKVIPVCIAVGEENGTDVYKLYHLVCENGQSKTLEEIFNVTD